VTNYPRTRSGESQGTSQDRNNTPGPSAASSQSSTMVSPPGDKVKRSLDFGDSRSDGPTGPKLRKIDIFRQNKLKAIEKLVSEMTPTKQIVYLNEIEKIAITKEVLEAFELDQ
jgi:hypothetical protein